MDTILFPADNFPYNGPVMQSYYVLLLVTQTSCLTNSSVTTDLRHHDVHVTSP